MLKAMFTIVMRMAPIEVTTMIRLRRMEIGSSGSLARFCQARNKAPSTTLALNPRITGESQACWRPPWASASSSRNTVAPTISSAPDSRCDAGRRADRSASVNQLSTMASRMSGNLNQNIQRQE